jgi:phage terminase large subunit GpA-like protein
MVITEEASPVDLATDRTFSFADRKIIIGSTPGNDETSMIAPLYEQSDKRIYEVPCPDCGEFNEILWPQIKWPEGKPHLAHYVCPSCGSCVEEKHKASMVKRGHWRATDPSIATHAGFRISALVSPLPNAAWGKTRGGLPVKEG